MREIDNAIKVIFLKLWFETNHSVLGRKLPWGSWARSE